MSPTGTSQHDGHICHTHARNTCPDSLYFGSIGVICRDIGCTSVCHDPDNESGNDVVDIDNDSHCGSAYPYRPVDDDFSCSDHRECQY